MGRGRAPLVLIGLVALALPAAAQQSPANQQPGACDGSSDAARQFKLDGEPPIAGASIRHSLSWDCASILIYRLTPKLAPRPMTREIRQNPPPGYYDRPYSGTPHYYVRIHKELGRFEGPMWADQKTCPALLPVVEALERALAPKLTGDGPSRGGYGQATMDGASVHVWAAGEVYPLNNMSHRFNMDYKTNLGAPTADWVEKTLRDIAPCLSPNEPAMEEPIP